MLEHMKILVPNEISQQEKRVALTPQAVADMLKNHTGVTVDVVSQAGTAAGYTDDDYTSAGANIIKQPQPAELTVCVNAAFINKWRPAAGHYLLGMVDPLQPEKQDIFNKFAEMGVGVLAMEKMPRTSRAQSMDALSSQANIGGYRAVIEAAQHYHGLMPLMMTAAGTAKPARVVVLGAGVAGLQAIATARRLGAQVEAFDIRPEVKEQIASLGAKFLEFDLEETAAGEGGYAAELSPAAREKQQILLQEHLKKADIVITTAQIPGRPAPTLVTEDAVKGMRPGSVIIDMAAGSGGNCPLSQPDEVIEADGVKVVGYTNYPSMLAPVASQFYAKNILHVLNLLLEQTDEKTRIHHESTDDIVQAIWKVKDGDVL